MKAIVQDRVRLGGRAGASATSTDPVVGEGDVLVRVRAAGAGPTCGTS